MNSVEIVVFSKPGLGTRKSGLAEAVNRPNLTFAVSPKYLSNETKIYIFISRIPRLVYIILGGFFKNFLFPTSSRYLQTSALKEITKVYERFLVTSNKKTAFDVQVSLANLDFAVYTVSKYICRHCLGILKERPNLKQNLKGLQECMRREYAASVEKSEVSTYLDGSRELFSKNWIPGEGCPILTKRLHWC